MKNSKRKLFAIILTIAMIVNSSLVQRISSDGVQDVYAQENAVNAAESVSMGQEQLEVSGNNGVGSLLAKEINGELKEQQENQGYAIFDVTVEGKMAIISLDVVEDCRLIVGIYSEDGKNLLASSVVDVEKTAANAVVTLETQDMPQYFLVKVFLIDETMSPLCSVYQSELYTKEMQEFLTKTTDDFEQNKVLNLDEDKTNNFAVYKDSVKKIEKENNKNIVISANDETGVYILENIDNTITNLKNGDIFAYTYNGQELIVKVDLIVVNGTTATIYSQETSLDEVFDYVKIDNTGDLSDAIVDTSSLDKDIIYNGLVEDVNEVEAYLEEGIKPQVEIEGGIGASFSHTIKEKKLGSDDNYVKVSGDLKFSAKAKVKVYVTFSRRYLEVRLDCFAKISLKAEGKGEGKLKLTTIGMAICPGVYLEFTPSFVVRANIIAELSGKLSATIGFRYSSDEGFENISSAPKFDNQLKVEGTIFLGLSLEPKLAIVSEKVAKASIEAEVGVELKAVIDSKNEDTENVKHECNLCVDGDISAKAKVLASVKFLNKDKWSLSVKLFDISHKIGDFYYSLAFGDYGIGTCSHFKYKMNVNVCDSDGQKLGNVKIVADGHEYETNNEGYAEFFVNEGKKIFTFSKMGYETYKKEVRIYGKAIELDNKAKEIFVKLRKKNGEITDDESEEQGKLKIQSQTVSLGGSHSAVITEDGSLYLWGSNSSGQLGNGTEDDSSIPIKIMENVTSVSLGYSHSAAITGDGSLYLWGDNYYGKLGVGTWYNSNTPIKIMENVASVSLGRNHSAAITKEGSLYLWGNNDYGQLGNGTTNLSSTPIKIMENTVNVNLGWYHSAVITKDKSLYLWGKNDEKQLGNGTSSCSSVPIKIMENVESVSLGYSHSATITEEGSLYLWGDNYYGQLGNGTSQGSSIPIKIMENIESATLGRYHSAAITKEGSLYLWGSNSFGQLGDGTTNLSSIPIKIMENIESLSLGDNHSAAITKDRSLYLWGYNYNGQLGNGIKRYSSTPIKIMENVESVSLGYFHSASIMQNGNLYLWGNNDYGQLGDGTKKASSTPIKIMENIMSVSLGWRHSAAITKQGDLYLWGFNDEGQLGNGTLQESSIPIKIMENVESVSLGWQHSAAVTKEGSLYLWGYNYSHQLGNSGKRYSSVPIKIMENVESVSLGDNHSAAITKEGSLYLWGSNNYGQLGNGTTSFSSSIPIKIMENVESVSLGDNHSAAITKDGNLYLWGGNYNGQLGNGTSQGSSIPIKIMENVESVSLGKDYSATITKDGNLYLWGINDEGQLGNGTSQGSSIPIKIMENVERVSLGSYHSTVITKEGSLYLWGDNYNGQLGNGIIVDSFIPTKIMDNIKIPLLKYKTIFNEQNVYIPIVYNLERLASTHQPSIALSTTSSSFTNLVPNVEYIFYIVKSEESGQDLLFADNILYINQGRADKNGNLAFDFNNKIEWTNEKVFLIGGVGDGNITLDDIELTCSIAPKTTVGQLKEKLHKRFQLVDSDNVEITDNKSFIQSGNILCLFDSKGEIAKKYTICIIGDVNRDGIINIQDAVILKRHLAGYSDLKLSEEASDINGDGILNIRDAIILLKYCAGMNIQLGKQ